MWISETPSDKNEVKSIPQDRRSTHTWRGSSSKSTLDAEILKEYYAPATQPTAHLGTCCSFVGPISLPWSVDTMLNVSSFTRTPQHTSGRHSSCFVNSVPGQWHAGKPVLLKHTIHRQEFPISMV